MSLEHPGGEQRAANEKKEDASARGKSVLLYIMVLFIAAFLLMTLSFLTNQRSNSETLGALQSSVSSMQEFQAAQEKIIALQEELDAAKEALNAATDALEAAQGMDIGQLQSQLQTQSELSEQYAQELERTVRAMDLFWQIDEAYVLGRRERCRQLIQLLEAQSLAPSLPALSTTDNGRFSPYDRYAEICQALSEPYGGGARP